MTLGGQPVPGTGSESPPDGLLAIAAAGSQIAEALEHLANATHNGSESFLVLKVPDIFMGILQPGQTYIMPPLNAMGVSHGSYVQWRLTGIRQSNDRGARCTYIEMWIEMNNERIATIRFEPW